MREAFTLQQKGWEFAQKLADKQKLSDISWAAGFFDGEGCIRVNKTRRKNGYTYSLQITVRQVDPKPILAFKRIVDDGSIQYYFKSNKRIDTARSIYTWSTVGPSAVKVLNKLLPYLKSKHEQAEIALDFQSTIKYQKGFKLTNEQILYREECFQKLKELKWQQYPEILL